MESVHQLMLDAPMDAAAASVSGSRMAVTVNSTMSRRRSVFTCSTVSVTGSPQVYAYVS